MQKWYRSARWRKYKQAYLKQPEHALCAICLAKTPEQITPATLIDHIVPARGNYDLFWNPDNHQPACAPCNNAKAARGE